MSSGLIRTAADWVPLLRQRIAELRMTHLEVDHRAGLADGHTSKILCGMKRPSCETLMRLCASLDLILWVAPKKDAADARSCVDR